MTTSRSGRLLTGSLLLAGALALAGPAGPVDRTDPEPMPCPGCVNAAAGRPDPAAMTGLPIARRPGPIPAFGDRVGRWSAPQPFSR